MTIDRRLLLKAATLGLGALSVPGAAQALARRGFTHGVASGEPRQRSVMLWTRHVPGGRLHWQVSRDPGFRRIVAEGDVTAEAERDYCVKPVASGLEPGRRYHYRFRDTRGAVSAAGRTRTLPEGKAGRFTLGIFSCSNLPFGFFNAYAHAAVRDDLDLLVHLGDYLYEYPRGTYPDPKEAMGGRAIHPIGETVALADYRLRYAAYRSDPDLQRLHASAPMVMMWDDHESANDSWQNGAENHQKEEGDWAVRKAAAIRACREWLPLSDKGWESYEIGELATLFRPETRLAARSRILSYGEALAGAKDVRAALAAFGEGPLRDAARTMMGSEQERWLAAGLRASARRGARWQVLAQQTIMGSLALPPESESWIGPNAPEFVRKRSAVGLAASKAGLPMNLDAWDGYPAARERLLRAALEADSNLIVLAGDSHNGWAFDLDLGGTPAGVEFAGQSVTSPGLEAYVPSVAPADLAKAMVARNRQLRWADIGRRGYLSLELTPERATGTWHFLETIRTRSTRLSGTHRMTVPRGNRRFA